MTEAVGLEETCKDILPPPSQGQKWEQSEGTGQAPMQMCAKLQEQDMDKAAKQFGNEGEKVHLQDEKP